jgi:hypothetical protein
VVIRYRLAPSEHGAHGESLTDVLGELTSYTDGSTGGSLTVLRKDGESIVIPMALVVAAKVIPAAVPRRNSTSSNSSDAGTAE